MSQSLPSFAEYVASLSQLSNPFDPTISTAESEEIRAVAGQPAGFATIDRATLVAFVADNPNAVPVLGLAVGLTREKLTSWSRVPVPAARPQPPGRPAGVWRTSVAERWIAR